MRNIEIKARVADLAPLRERIMALGAAASESLQQTDTFFHVPRGRMKLREFGDGSAELIYYERPDEPEPKLSRYLRAPCPDPSSLCLLLREALEVRGIVKKRRELFRLGQTRVHLDDVDGLGNFVELEVVLEENQSVSHGQRVARDLMARIGLEGQELVATAYIDLLERLKVNAGSVLGCDTA